MPEQDHSGIAHFVDTTNWDVPDHWSKPFELFRQVRDAPLGWISVATLEGRQNTTEVHKNRWNTIALANEYPALYTVTKQHRMAFDSTHSFEEEYELLQDLFGGKIIVGPIHQPPDKLMYPQAVYDQFQSFPHPLAPQITRYLGQLVPYKRQPFVLIHQSDQARFMLYLMAKYSEAKYGLDSTDLMGYLLQYGSLPNIPSNGDESNIRKQMRDQVSRASKSLKGSPFAIINICYYKPYENYYSLVAS
ncbi:MAG: hypothetical protein US54_C0032G0006 [Candidatus Roizmanbacteria bacterium GW2011_GWA2_37_7]|uniref:Uncharacterized protein n=1 Tax=Candidatus Roizmanbacteria bacterium GW2011_GWA2_37_7 TaxID=1618481 RepID=A0A0G0H2N9_9BACT|nr:MAG: hypothetical protein US54_C0032G0006 [Candidatus Roizmanbacteria bacterium GW2011_GWA2_37_7]